VFVEGGGNGVNNDGYNGSDNRGSGSNGGRNGGDLYGNVRLATRCIKVIYILA
jgi:hypothetical protein